MIDLEGESRAIRERSLELAGLLEAGIPTVDRRPIAPLRAESARLATEANRAREAVAERVRQRLDPGAVMGPIPPIRRLPTGKDTDATLRGRTVVTDELVSYWRHRRDQLGPGIVGCYEAASLPRLPAVTLAAVEGHLALLRSRGDHVDEGASTLQGALTRYQSVPEQLAIGTAEGQAVIAEAEARLSSLLSEEMAIRTGQGTSWESWAAGRLAAFQADPLDLPAEVPAPPETFHPVGRAEPPAVPTKQPVRSHR
jgi:hypothetical protein